MIFATDTGGQLQCIELSLAKWSIVKITEWDETDLVKK